MGDIIITGAGGFLGQAVVAAARAKGHRVRAMVRSTVPSGWADDRNIQVIQGDLADRFAPGPIAIDDVVIHAAASFGDDAVQARDTIQATAHILDALPKGARLVLVSSFSVYDYVALSDDALLDESAALEPNGSARDAYTRAKIAQEQAVAQKDLDLRIARPAVIYASGPRAWTSLLGWKVGPFILTTAPKAQIPAIHVDDCAAQLVQLAMLDIVDAASPINLVAAYSPTREAWIKAIGRKPLALPKGLLFGFSKLLGPVLPKGLGLPKLAARFKPLRYDTARSDAVFGVLPPHDALASMKESE